MKKMREKKMNNKGFSLVELIIVVAIMAVLIGVLAPTYMQYVEKSKRSADLDNYQAIISAVQIYCADPDSTPITGGTLTVDTNGVVTVDANLEAVLTNAGITVNQTLDPVTGAVTSRVVAGMEIESTDFNDADLSVTVSGGICTFSTADNELRAALNL